MTDKKPTLTLDVAVYQHHLDHTNMSEEEKAEYLETLWTIICEFITIGFHVNPVQMAIDDNQPPCGKDEKTSLSPMDSIKTTVESTIEEGA